VIGMASLSPAVKPHEATRSRGFVFSSATAAGSCPRPTSGSAPQPSPAASAGEPHG
jgi:hypothetical protein